MSPTLRFVLALTLLLPALAVAHPHSALHGHDELGWAVVRGEHRHTSSMDDLDEIDDLKSRFGDDFLYIRDGDERYVITNRAMIDRAEDASNRIVDPAKAIAKAAARLAVSQAKGTKARAKLESAESQLEAAIERQELRGQEADELQRALERVRQELGEIEATGERRPVTPSEQKELESRRDEAHERLERAVAEMRAEIRDILVEAKDKGQAKRVR
jgi:chromosome segregation ATPase